MARVSEEAKQKHRNSMRDYQREINKQKRLQEQAVGSIPKCKHKRRRSLASKSLKKFALTYHKDIFYNPITDEQAEDFKTIEYAIRNGGLFALGAPRGDGKTTRFKVGLLWAILNNHCKFGVLITAESASADEAIDFFKIALETNEKLLEDYPEVCVPVRALEGSATRARTQHIDGERTHVVWSKNRIVMPTVPNSKVCGSVISVTSIEGRIRGMQHTTADGKIIRPDFVLIDDPQNDEVAASPHQVQKRIKTIKTSILGLSGQGKSVTCVMAATIIQKYDLAWRFLDRDEHPEWQGVTRKMLESFPTDIKFWESEYHEAYMKSLELQDDNKYVNDFYKEHQKQLEKGSVVNNEGRKGDNDVSALQHAMHLYFTRGRDAFYSEYQNEPVDDSGSLYTITPKIVRSNVNGYNRGVMPDQAKHLTVMADINFIGLNWVATGFENDFTAYVIDYGKYPDGSKMLYDPEKDTEKTAEQSIAKGIVELILFFMEKDFGDHRYTDLLMIDANYKTEAVIKMINGAVRKHKPPFKVLPHRGRSYKYYKVRNNTLVGTEGDRCHLETYERYGYKSVQVVQDSDYWRMATQKSFMHSPGVNGSCSIFGDRPIIHDGFAREICAERLDNFAITENGNMYKWNIQPGQHNDKLDALVGCFAGASLLGCSFTDAPKRKAKAVKKKKPLPPSKKRTNIRRRY